MRRLTALLLLVLGCPSSPPPEETTPTVPMMAIAIDGQVLYTERPMDEVPQPISNAWERFQEAWEAEPPMPPADADAATYRTFASQRFAPYVDGQVDLAVGLLGALEDTTDPEEALVYSVLAARLLHRAASWMWTLPLPDEASVNAEARQALEQTMHGAAKNLAVYAHAAFGKCVEAASAIPGLGAWRADCENRSEAVEPIRTAQIGPPPPTPMPEGCEDHADPTYASPQHDPEARPQLLVLVEAESEAIDEAAVQRQVERWARSEHGLRPVPAGRRRAAERLVEASKTSRRGPECAAAPSLTWVLGAQIEHLVVAKVTQECNQVVVVDDEGRQGEPQTECGLTISWRRAASRNTEELPPVFGRPLPTEPDTAAVVEALSSDPPESVGVVSGLTGSNAAEARMTVAPMETNPGYRLRSAIGGLGIEECQAERGANQLQLSWTVTPTGAIESARVQGGDEAIRSCVREKLEQLALPCTPSGDPIAMQTTLCLAR